jgi:hypothetical protein
MERMEEEKMERKIARKNEGKKDAKKEQERKIDVRGSSVGSGRKQVFRPRPRRDISTKRD